jgi:hypothetical protein
MKKSFKYLTMIMLALTMSFVGCKKDDKEKAEDAKVELQAATQEIFYNVALVMSTPQVESMMFLTQLMGLQIDLKSSIQKAVFEIDRYNVVTAKRYIYKRFLSNTRNEIDPLQGGVYTFNFQTGEFDLTNSEVTYLQINYPANQVAYGAEQNNASLRLDNFEYVEIEFEDDWGIYTEIMPIKADVVMTVDGQTVMTLAYNGAFTNDGMPTLVSLGMNMQPYQFDLSFSGSGVNYNSTMSFKQNNADVLKYNLNLTYTSSMDYLERATGFIEATPLRFDGSVNALAMESCGDNDINCMNNNMNVEVLQTAKDLYLGDLEFRMYLDEEWDEEYPELAIVYEDGSYQFLFEFLGVLDGLGKKRLTKR